MDELRASSNPKIKELFHKKEEERVMKSLKKAEQKKKQLFKDLGKPKKPASAFNLFYAEKFNSIKKSTGGSVADVMRALSSEWKEASEDARSPYVSKAEDLKVEYKKAHEAWLARVE